MLLFNSARMKSPHCLAIAPATWGNVRLRYFPRELRTNSFGEACSMVGIIGGRLRSQYNVFFVYFTPNQDGSINVVGGGNLAILIGIGFSTATNLAHALRHLKKKILACCIFSYLSILIILNPLLSKSWSSVISSTSRNHPHGNPVSYISFIDKYFTR